MISKKNVVEIILYQFFYCCEICLMFKNFEHTVHCLAYAFSLVFQMGIENKQNPF